MFSSIYALNSSRSPLVVFEQLEDHFDMCITPIVKLDVLIRPLKPGFPLPEEARCL
jgi:hypothetical protein